MMDKKNQRFFESLGGELIGVELSSARQQAIRFNRSETSGRLFFIPPAAMGCEAWMHVLIKLRKHADMTFLHEPEFDGRPVSAMDQWRQLLDAWVAQCNTPVVLIGASAGALIGLRYANQRPENIKGLIATGIQPEALTLRRLIRAFQFDTPLALTSMMAQMYVAPQIIHPERAAQLFKKMTRPSFQSFIAEISGLNPFHETFGCLRLGIPLLFILGDKDPFVQHRETDIAFWSGPKPAVQIIENCGHYPQTEKPGVVCEKIASFA